MKSHSSTRINSPILKARKERPGFYITAHSSTQGQVMPNHRPGTASLHRINLDAEIILLNEAQSWTLKLVDISLKGALIEQPVNWDGQLSEHYQLQINPGDGNTCITMDTTIVHIEDNPIDQHCEHFDVDSINRFRRLVEVEFNIGDDFLLKCELSAMIQ